MTVLPNHAKTKRLILMGGLFIFILGCDASTNNEAAVVHAPPVTVVGVASQAVEDRIEATGQLLAREKAKVAAQVEGQVTELAADEGDAVTAGQIVVEIDPERRRLEVDRVRADLAQAEAQFGEAQRELARVDKLHAQGVASSAQLDSAQTEMRRARGNRVSAKARLGLAERALRDASVVAPFAGFLERRWVNTGEYVSPGETLFELVALDPVEVEFHVSEVDSSRVSIGQEVHVRVAPFPDEAFRAPVTFVAPSIDARTRTLRVKALLPNPGGRLRPGLFARLDLGVATRDNVLMVPKDAVLERADGSIVFRVRPRSGQGDADETGHVAERLGVEVGAFHGELVEVRGPLRPGDWIVSQGQSVLLDGSPVSLRNPDGTLLQSASVAPANESAAQ